MLKNKLVLALVAMSLTIVGTGCAQALFGLNKKKDANLKAEEVKEVTDAKADKETVVSMMTEKGEIKIKLYMDKAPITAGNFKDLVERHFYDGLNFHRLIANFMVQGGCPKGNGTGNFVDPETKETRYVQFEDNGLKNLRGTLAMARTSDPNTASSQFFINLVDNAFLDTQPGKPGYAVFAEVVDGMDIVDKIMAENKSPFPGSDGTANPVKIKHIAVI